LVGIQWLMIVLSRRPLKIEKMTLMTKPRIRTKMTIVKARKMRMWTLRQLTRNLMRQSL
jgi:hypothetical protein